MWGCSLVRDSGCESGKHWCPGSSLCEVSRVSEGSCYLCQSTSVEAKGRRRHRCQSCGSSNVRQLPRRLKLREGRLWSSELVVFHKSRPSDRGGHPKTALFRRMLCRLRAYLRAVLFRCQNLGGKKVEIKLLTYTHFSHPLDVIVSAVGNDDQVVGFRIRIRRTKATVWT